MQKIIFCGFVFVISLKVYCEPLSGPDPNMINSENTEAISGAPYICKVCRNNLDSNEVAIKTLNLQLDLLNIRTHLGPSVLLNSENDPNN